MKYLVILLLIFNIVECFSQDKIILLSGDTLNVKITKSSNEMIEYLYPNEDAVNELYKNSVQSIIYSSGRVEKIANKLGVQTIQSERDWDKVIITYNKEDVKGLTRYKQVAKSSGWGGSMGSNMGYNDCIKKMKKEAAKNLCPIVLIVDNPSRNSSALGGGVKLVGELYK